MMRLGPLVVAGLILAACSSPGAELSSLPEQPDFAFVLEGTQLVVATEPGEQEVLWSLGDIVLPSAPTFIESIEPINSSTLFLGVCCDPEEGRQLIIDLDDGTAGILPLTVRFPSVGEERGASEFVSGGSAIVADNLGAFLAYENGVGVVPRGVTIREAQGTTAFVPELLAGDRVAFVDATTSGGNRLVVTDLEGSTLMQSSVGDAQDISYDARNDVIVVLSNSNEVSVLSAETLVEITSWTLAEPTTSIDSRDGWVLLSQDNGSVISAPITDPGTTTALVEQGAATASWLSE